MADPLRDDLAALADEWSCPTCQGDETCVYCNGATYSRVGVSTRLRALLAKHPERQQRAVDVEALADLKEAVIDGMTVPRGGPDDPFWQGAQWAYGQVREALAEHLDQASPRPRRTSMPEHSADSDSGPHERCRRCGGANVVWFAPSPLWNLVMRENDINGPIQFGDLVCIPCFIGLAAERGVQGVWRIWVDPEPEGLVTVTPSGRVWNEETHLWDEPTTRVIPPERTGADGNCTRWSHNHDADPERQQRAVDVEALADVKEALAEHLRQPVPEEDEHA